MQNLLRRLTGLLVRKGILACFFQKMWNVRLTLVAWIARVKSNQTKLKQPLLSLSVLHFYPLSLLVFLHHHRFSRLHGHTKPQGSCDGGPLHLCHSSILLWYVVDLTYSPFSAYPRIYQPCVTRILQSSFAYSDACRFELLRCRSPLGLDHQFA